MSIPPRILQPGGADIRAPPQHSKRCALLPAQQLLALLAGPADEIASFCQIISANFDSTAPIVRSAVIHFSLGYILPSSVSAAGFTHLSMDNKKLYIERISFYLYTDIQNI